MSSPTEHAMNDGENAVALSLIAKTLPLREEHEDHSNFAYCIMSSLHDADLIVVKRSDWQTANDLRKAAATLLLAAKV